MSVCDVLENSVSPAEVMALDLPLVFDLIKAKVRLEQTKAQARKRARELEAINKGKLK